MGPIDELAGWSRPGLAAALEHYLAAIKVVEKSPRGLQALFKRVAVLPPQLVRIGMGSMSSGGLPGAVAHQGDQAPCGRLVSY